MQCPHCLRRYPKTEITTHTRSCDLRTELCKLGCGSKVRFIKMAQHLETCPKKEIVPVPTAASTSVSSSPSSKMKTKGKKYDGSLENSFDSTDEDESDKERSPPRSSFPTSSSSSSSYSLLPEREKKQHNDD